jgi:hypothetical protein
MADLLPEGTIPLAQMSDHELADDAVDPRGWEVTTPAFAPVGVVRELLVDVDTMRVRYLEVALGDGTEPTVRRVLVPIGRVQVDDALDRVVVTVPSCLDTLPSYEPSTFDRAFERAVLGIFGDDHDGEDFYACPAFDDSGFSRGQRRRHPRRRHDEPGAEEVQEIRGTAELQDATGSEIRVVAEG